MVLENLEANSTIKIILSDASPHSIFIFDTFPFFSPTKYAETVVLLNE